MMLTLKAIRANCGLSQKEAGEKIGVSEYTWSNYEKGKTFPDVPTLKKIESEFGISYNQIIFFTH